MEDRRSPLGRARGLGTAKDGVGHWWTERLSALALVPLTLWFVVSLAAHAGADYAEMREWIGSPLVAGLLVMLIVTTFYHGALGIQVVVEDYVHNEAVKLASVLVVKFLAFLLCVVALLAVLSIFIGG